jgi:hypothetical protein
MYCAKFSTSCSVSGWTEAVMVPSGLDELAMIPQIYRSIF